MPVPRPENRDFRAFSIQEYDPAPSLYRANAGDLGLGLLPKSKNPGFVFGLRRKGNFIIITTGRTAKSSALSPQGFQRGRQRHAFGLDNKANTRRVGDMTK